MLKCIGNFFISVFSMFNTVFQSVESLEKFLGGSIRLQPFFLVYFFPANKILFWPKLCVISRAFFASYFDSIKIKNFF